MSRIAPERSRPVYGSAAPTAKRPESKPKRGGLGGFFASLFTFDFLKSEPAQPKLLRAFQDHERPVLAQHHGSLTAIDSRASLEIAQAGAPPTADDFKMLAETNRPVVAFAQSASGAPFGMMTPAGFDPQTSGAMKVRTVFPPKGSSVADVVGELAKSPPNIPGTIVVVSDRKQPAFEATSQVLEHLLHLSADFGTHHTVTLPADASAWRGAVESGQDAKMGRLAGPIVGHANGTWSQFPPTTNYKIRLPGPGDVKATQKIPKSMQKQSADRGAFLTPVMKSEALGSNVRFGVYLPPGYDPSAAKKYPVLLMLPGKSDLLSHWTSVGQLTGKLDHMMRGDAQKMIVVVADGNESFFVNDEPDAKDPRRYQDFVVDELVDYATKNLAGDRDRLSLAGISRGGFGAMVAAAHHPGMFKAVSSHSGSLGPQRNTKSSHNPTRLVRDGALDESPPRLRFDVGAKDPYFVDETIDLVATLQQRGTPVDAHVLDAGKSGGDKHNWDLWGPSIESWIAFHQETYGKATSPKVEVRAKDVAQELIEKRRQQSSLDWSTLADQSKAARRTIADASATIHRLEKEFSTEFAAAFDLVGLTALNELATQAADAADTLLVDRPGVYDGGATSIANGLKRATSSIQDALAAVTEDLSVITQMPEAAGIDVAMTIAKEPSLREPLLGLARRRPAVFDRDDPVTKKNFATQVRGHVENFLDDKDVPGFGEFLRRMTTGKFKWKVSGFSHSVGPGLTTWLEHPGLVLSMVEASMKNEPFGLHRVYDGDGPSALRPSRDLANAWRPIVKTKGDGAFSNNSAVLAGADFRYERGLSHVLVDDLKPDHLPSDRKGGRCAPVALALQKLTGVETHYYYAFNLQTGADLAAAFESQNGYGIAMADVEFGHDPEKLSFSHFPVFYDYDAATNTCWWQDFSQRPPQKLSLEGLEFSREGKTRCAIYCRPSEALAPLLTLDQQTGSQTLMSAFDLTWGEREGL